MLSDSVRVSFERHNASANAMTEYFKWWVVDRTTGERRQTSTHLNRDDAQRVFPGAVPDLLSREFRDTEEFANTLPPD